jgi:hypothetical protein
VLAQAVPAQGVGAQSSELMLVRIQVLLNIGGGEFQGVELAAGCGRRGWRGSTFHGWKAKLFLI